MVVKSIDLRNCEARNRKERTFKPTHEVGDLGLEEDLIIGMEDRKSTRLNSSHRR